MSAERPPLLSLTHEDIGPAVIVIVYTLALLSVAFSILHFWNAAARKTAIGFDDAWYILANLWAIASSVTWHLAVNNGLGRRISNVSPSSVDKFFKVSYAAQLIEIVTMLCAKVAFALLSDRVAPRDRWPKIIALSVLAAWGVFSIFALAFQCPLPEPWVFEPAQCPTHGNLLYAIIALNAVTDVALALWIAPTVWCLQAARMVRTWVIVLFGFRLIVLAPILTELSLMHIFLGNSDQTRVTVNRAILDQITVYVSLLTSILPRTNQFLSQLHIDRNVLTMLDSEISARQSPARQPEPPLGLVLPNDSVMNTATYSSTESNKTFEFLPRGVAVRRDIVVSEMR